MGRNMAPVPVILLAGFLGAGKTTLLQHILSGISDLSDTIVIVNEFGKIGIDGELLRRQNLEVVELANGCICCTLNMDLTVVLDRILDRFSPNRILIEASGVGDPTGIISAVSHARYHGRLIMANTITVLNADDWDAREVFGRLFYHQLETAQVILLNKIDLFPSEDISRMLCEIRSAIPNAVLIPTQHCRIDPGALWSSSVMTPDEIPLQHFSRLQPQATALGFVSFLFETDDIMDADRFDRFVRQLPREVFRIKGPVKFSNQTLLLNVVGGRTDWSEWTGAPKTRLAFIGINANEADTLPQLHACLKRRDTNK